jgi:hypothetical protein
MNISKLGLCALAGSLLLTTACEKDLLKQNNPNIATSQSFWQTSDDAVKGVNAVYSGLQQLGTYRRWLHFALDLRSDDGFSTSPWGELADFTKFRQVNYDFEPSRDIWRDHYRAINRANQVIASVPGITMNEGLKKRVIAEAKFLRALYYYNLVSLYGNVPLALEPSTVTSRPPQGTEAQVWDQVIADLQAAEPDLEASYTGNDIGRATRGAAATLLGKAYMQLRRWPEASTQFQKVIADTRYNLVANYEDNFKHTTEYNSESIFEVGFSDVNLGGNDGDDASSSEGGQRSQFWGVPGDGFTDGEVRPWVRDQFLTEATAAGTRDPRLGATLFYNPQLTPNTIPRGPEPTVYGEPFNTRFAPGSTNNSRIYWRKYSTDYYRTFENFDSPINHRVMRLADVLLLQAEALNEQGQTAAAIPLINRVRTRAGMTPLVAGSFTQASLRTRIMHERVTELTGEGLRWFDLKRWGVVDPQPGIDQNAALAAARTRDPDFISFELNKSRLIPIPRTDVDVARLTQNPGWQ